MIVLDIVWELVILALLLLVLTLKTMLVEHSPVKHTFLTNKD